MVTSGDSRRSTPRTFSPAPGQICVAVENPGFPPLRAALLAAGALWAAVPVDGEGMRVDRGTDGVKVILRDAVVSVAHRRRDVTKRRIEPLTRAASPAHPSRG